MILGAQMTNHFHAVVWLDHREARIFYMGLSGVDRFVLHPDHPTKHLHHKANSIGSGHASPDKQFMKSIGETLSDAREILILGPAGAKTELAKFLREYYSPIGNRIVAILDADHPSDGQIVDYAKRYFKIAEHSTTTASANR